MNNLSNNLKVVQEHPSFIQKFWTMKLVIVDNIVVTMLSPHLEIGLGVSWKLSAPGICTPEGD